MLRIKRDIKSRVGNDDKYPLYLTVFIAGIAQFLLSIGRGENKIKTLDFFDNKFVSQPTGCITFSCSFSKATALSKSRQHKIST